MTNVCARNLRRDERGSMITEFTIGVTLIMIVMLGIFDFARLAYVRHYVAQASASGARYAMVRGSTWAGTCGSSTSGLACQASNSDISSYIRQDMPAGVVSSKLTIVTTWPGTTPLGTGCDNLQGNNSPGCVVNVKVSYNFGFLFPFLPQNAFGLTSTSIIAISQ